MSAKGVTSNLQAGARGQAASGLDWIGQALSSSIMHLLRRGLYMPLPDE